MEHVFSAEERELELAWVLVMLPRLVWEADHGPPCTHNLRWGAKKRRSVGDDDDPREPPHARAPLPARPPPLRLPAQPPAAADKKPSKKHRMEPVVAAAESLEEAAAAGQRNSSMEMPLDFFSTVEELDAKAKAPARPSNVGRPPAKKPKPKHEQLSKQVEQLNLTRTELEKEAAESRNRLEALKKTNSELLKLRIKEGEQHRQEESKQRLPYGRSCLDLLAMAPVQPLAAAHAQQQRQQQPYQPAWPQHWVNNHIMFHQVAPGFSVHPPPAGAAGSQQWSWAASQARRADGDGVSTRAGQVPDLNSSATADFGMESQQQQQGNCYSYHHQQEQRAARKRRIEMIKKRRNALLAVAPVVSSANKIASVR